jgi:hypothetical protein
MSEAASNLGGQRDNEPGYRCTCGGKKRAQPQPNRSPARIACGCLVEAGETPAVRFIYMKRDARHASLWPSDSSQGNAKVVLFAGKSHDFGLVGLKLDRRLR